MKNIKTIVIFGTRPEAIKLAPVIAELKKRTVIETIVCSTGQHREMLKQVLDIFKLKVDYDLDLMKNNQDLFDISINALQRLKEVLLDVKPDLIIVQGDTTTAFISALASFYLKIKIAHVEAGLRSHNIFSPFPEEANRKFISSLADFNFAPTDNSAGNLKKEGCKKDSIFVTGNTVVDALIKVKSVIKNRDILQKISGSLTANNQFLFNKKKFVLVTMHRREKFGSEMETILRTFYEISTQFPHYNFIYPVHLNPNVKVPVEKILGKLTNFYLIPPQDYISFIYLMSKCEFIMSDSGGIQEECYVFKKPIIVLRDVTERNEAVKAGYAFLVGSDPDKIREKFQELVKKLSKKHNFFLTGNPFGDGKASSRIVKTICQYFLKGKYVKE